MKRFSSYITELFDKTHPWKNWQSGGNHWMYQFAFAKVRGGKMVPCPMQMDEIEKFYESQGLKITGRDSNDRPIINGKEGQTPYTVCDLLANPKPSKFVDLIKGDLPDASAKWIDELDRVKEAFFDWFEAQGGRKARMIKVFYELMSCKNRAPWASWSGKAYRGVMRSTKIVSKYDFTGEVKKIGNIEWLIAKGIYKSRYEAQSWSDEWRTAREFATGNNMSGVENPIGVIFEVNLKKTDTLLSPDVVRQISMYGTGAKKEREVIRVGNAPLAVTVYVNADNIVDSIVTNSSNKQFGNNARMYVYNRAVSKIGVKGADAFAKTKEFDKLVKDFK